MSSSLETSSKSLKILVVRPDRIGDVVLSTPVFEVLKRHYPRAHLTVMVKEAVVPLVRGLPSVDDVLVYDLGPQEFRGLKETRDGFAAVMNMTDPHMKLLDFNVDSDGNLGVQIDIQQVSLTPKGGQPISFTMRQSDCMRHVGDKWYSVFEELSVPVDAATGKAVMHP